MKYAKMCGLLTAMAVALMMFTGTASASLTSPAGTTFIGWIHGNASVTFDGTINVSCSYSTLREFHWSGETKGEGIIWSFESCGNHTVTTNKPGNFYIQSIGGGKGTMFSTGAEITVLTHSLFLGTRHCIYATNNTHIGTITGGFPATMSVDSAPIPQVGTDALCGNDTEMTGSYNFGPVTLLID